MLARVNGAKATITKPGNYYFVANMYYAATTEPGAISTVAITVNAAGPVTINMRGFSLTGPSQQFLDGYYTNPVAISINSGNVTVKNGSIAGFYRPIVAGGTSTATGALKYLSGIDLENLVFSGGFTTCVSFDGVNNSIIRDCDFNQGVSAGGPSAILDDSSQTGNNFINDKVNNRDPVTIYGLEDAPDNVTYTLNLTVRKRACP